jgi:hypothetical protein
MKEPDLEEERLIATARGLKITIDRRSMEQNVNPIRVSGPGGDVTEVKLEASGAGLWSSTIEVKLPGLYKAETEGPSGPLTAVAHAGNEDPREMSEVTASAAKLEPLISSTGGGVFWTRASPGVEPAKVDIPRVTLLSGAKVLAGSGWLGLKDREAFATRGVKLTPMFTGLLALAALLALLSLAWWREGR